MYFSFLGSDDTARVKKVKVKAFQYSIPNVGPGADTSVQAVSLQVTVSHPPGVRLPLLPAMPAVTSPAAEHHRLWPVLVIAIPEIPISGFPEIPFSPKSRNSGIFQAKIPEIRDFHFLHYLL